MQFPLFSDVYSMKSSVTEIDGGCLVTQRTRVAVTAFAERHRDNNDNNNAVATRKGLVRWTISLLTKNLHRREGTEEISPAWRNSVRGSPGRGLTCRRSYPCQLTRSRCTPSRMRCKSRFVQIKQTNVLMFCFVTLGAVVDTTWGFRMWPPIVIWTSRIVGSISIINTYSASSSEQIGLLW